MTPSKLLGFRAIGALLFIASLFAVYRLRPHEVSSADFTAHPQILSWNIWQLRWRFGWESTKANPMIDGAPATALTWKMDQGGTLTAGLASDNQGCVVYKATIPQGPGKEDLILTDTVTAQINKAKANIAKDTVVPAK